MPWPRVLTPSLTLLALLLGPVADQAAGQDSFYSRQFRKLEQQQNQQQQRPSANQSERRKEAVAENIAEKALRQAMLEVIDKGEGESVHPAYWAPFIVVGDHRAR
jgi:CHAT domain-containing protein